MYKFQLPPHASLDQNQKIIFIDKRKSEKQNFQHHTMDTNAYAYNWERLTHREDSKKGLDLKEEGRVNELELWRNRRRTKFLMIVRSLVYDRRCEQSRWKTLEAHRLKKCVSVMERAREPLGCRRCHTKASSDTKRISSESPIININIFLILNVKILNLIVI